MSYRMGIDIGGTFTDFALIDDRTGTLTIHKQLTTPSDPSVAVLDGAARLLRRAGLSFAELGSIIHGSTLVTNAVIERRGAVTGMLVTEGFSDVLDIAMERRYDIYDLRLRFPAPIVPRAMRAEIAERMQADGSVATALDPAAAVARVGELRERHGIVALAICYLHAFTNPMHEEQTRQRRRRGVSRSLPFIIRRCVSIHARVRAMEHHGDQCLCTTAGGSLSAAHRGEPDEGRISWTVARHDIDRWHRVGGDCAPLSGSHAGVGTRRGSSDVRLSRPAARPSQRARI